MNKTKSDEQVMRVLKVEYLAKPILNTSKGLLALVARKDKDEYYLTLDSVPLDEEREEILMKLIYSKE
jgi:hypothetical protein